MEKSFLSSSSLIWLSGLKSALSLDLREEEESLSYDARGVEILQHSFPSCICLDHIRYLKKNNLKGGSQGFPDDTSARLWSF